VSLPPFDVLGVVAASLFAARGRVDRLAIDARRGARAVGLPGRADLAAEQVVELIEGAVAAPLVEVPPDGALGREVDGQVASLASGAEDVEDDVAHVGRSGPTAGSGGREVRLDQGPLLVAEVAGVVVGSHPLPTSLGTLMG
jgi:hypothetical protein